MSPATDRESVRTAAAALFLRALLLVRKNLQIYPADNPAVDQALDRALAAWTKLAADGEIALTVRRDAFLIDGVRVPDPDGRFGRCAQDWYRRAVGCITFQPTPHANELRALLLTLNRSVGELVSTGGPAAQPALADLDSILLEHGDAITIMPAAEGAAVFRQLAQQAEQVLTDERLDDPAQGEAFFMAVAERDPKRLASLQALLAAPERLTLIFKTFALRVCEHTGNEQGLVLTQLVRIIEAAGEIVADLPDDGARQRVYRGLAEMVRGLPPDVARGVVDHGLLPDVPARGLAAQVLRLFPVPEIANALARSILADETALSTLADTIGGLALDDEDRDVLMDLTHGQLDYAGVPTADLTHLFSDVVLGALPDSTQAPVRGTEQAVVCLPAQSRITAESVRWQQHEYRKARREARRAALKSADLDLLPLLSEFIRMEQRPQDFAILVTRASGAIAGFVERGQYPAAIQLVQLLHAQLDDRQDTFTARQLEPVRMAIASLVNTRLVRFLLRAYDEAGPESWEAQRILEFFRCLGEPLLQHMVDQLDVEEHRHVRLLLCRTIAKLAKGRTSFLARCLDHPKWYVARNVMTIAAEMADADALPLAFRAVRHAEPRVVREALKTLAQIRTPEAAGAIVATLRAPNPEAQVAAASWLGVLGGPEAVRALTGVVQREVDGPQREVVLAAIESLGRIGTPEARSALEPLTRPGSFLARRRRAAVREAALAALQAAGTRT